MQAMGKIDAAVESIRRVVRRGVRARRLRATFDFGYEANSSEAE